VLWASTSSARLTGSDRPSRPRWDTSSAGSAALLPLPRTTHSQEPPGPAGFASSTPSSRTSSPRATGARTRHRRLALHAPGRPRRGDGRGLTDRELRDQVLTFIGPDTRRPPSRLAWTVYCSAGTQADGRLRTEVADALGGRHPSPTTCRGYPTRLGDRGILASLSAGHAVARDAVTEDEIGGYRIRPGRWSSSAPM
jgi:hypothetical protein